jgi:hypothetical protein
MEKPDAEKKDSTVYITIQDRSELNYYANMVMDRYRAGAIGTCVSLPMDCTTHPS